MTPRVLRLLAIGLLPGLLSPGALAQEPAAAAAVSAETVTELIGRAEAAQRSATELRAEWLETGGLIEQAREEANLGNLVQAAKLAELARRQSELAVAQAEREAEAWQRRVVR
jgi:hypothetical protein